MKEKTICFFLFMLFALSACSGKRGGSYEVVEASTGCGLCDAVKSGNTEQIELALDVGENPNTVDRRGISVLMYAARVGNTAIAKMLIRAGANINAIDENGNTPLMWAVSYGHSGVVKILLACGADAGLRNHQGVDPLYWAGQRHPGMVYIFRQHFTAATNGESSRSCSN